MSTTKIAIIGAGNVGAGLGSRLAKSGLEVQYGVRNPDGIGEVLARSPGAKAASPASAASWGDVVFLAVPGSAAIDVTKSLAKELEGRIVIDCNNPLTWQEGPVWAPPPEGSLTSAIAKAAHGARVLKAFNTFGAEFHADPNVGGAPATVFYAGDDADAKKTFAAVATKAGFDPVDAGPLRNAGVLENVAMLWIHLATVGGHGRDFVLALRSRKS
jgi:NADPH-dependent F420 reductase